MFSMLIPFFLNGKKTNSDIKRAYILFETNIGDLKTTMDPAKESMKTHIGVVIEPVEHPFKNGSIVVGGIALMLNIGCIDLKVGQNLSVKLPRSGESQFQLSQNGEIVKTVNPNMGLEFENLDLDKINNLLSWIKARDDPPFLEYEIYFRYCLAIELLPKVLPISVGAGDSVCYILYYELIILKCQLLQTVQTDDEKAAIGKLLYYENLYGQADNDDYMKAINSFENLLILLSKDELLKQFQDYVHPENVILPHEVSGSIMPKKGLVNLSKRFAGVVLAQPDSNHHAVFKSKTYVVGMFSFMKQLFFF